MIDITKFSASVTPMKSKGFWFLVSGILLVIALHIIYKKTEKKEN